MLPTAPNTHTLIYLLEQRNGKPLVFSYDWLEHSGLRLVQDQPTRPTSVR